MLELGEIDRTSDIPPYRQIAAHLRAAVDDGALAPGAQLPSETVLTTHYGVSRMTVRQALAELRTEGRVQAIHGRGVFVRPQLPVRRQAADRFARRHREAGKSAFLAESAELGTPSVDQIRVTVDAVPESVATLLGIAEGSRVVVRSRRYLLDGQPVEIATSYLPLDLAEGTRILDVNTGPGGIYARLEEKGHILERFVEEVSARMPSPTERQRLDLPGGAPVLTVLRRAIDTAGRVVEVCDTVKVAARYVLEYEFAATE